MEPAGEIQRWQAPGLALRLWPGWADDPGGQMSRLQQEIPWRQESITLFGRTHPLPRLTCWVADPGCSYRYSGLANEPQPWSEPLRQIREALAATLGWRFNSVLLNRYRDGDGAMGWHADDEAELEPQAPIASLSLGATRSFRLRPRARQAEGVRPISLELGHGDLLVMDPPTQQHWLHSLPRRRRVSQERLNLTFRLIRPQAASD
ncbi:alpha-ketoglutarate-dependent dioxygenase AlkB [Synechococcus sp. BSF8S]|uniref:alpha-ketoglutarate-dependent dioxygenase AlkB family protein n=1 Tax=Synechococcales TaxID=1890424 RepID=UPI0016267413|nr:MULTISPECIES: alpha-ketoglutarate-dependent dioxygenase AlkB [unclassified Synechococcus]MBC1262318.1 alpha-ketoglutarate-dependent dioxygenase AlkB [Synechococcus sp. BSF8S]MBC1265221.1 alpha-ketoglutarate-dependent dioxygenase AlkB [Synechococcus sp. BSA11S]